MSSSTAQQAHDGPAQASFEAMVSEVRDNPNGTSAPSVGPPRRAARIRVDATWAVAALAAAVAALGLVGADARWMVPLGRLVAHGHLPGSLPYAVAPTTGWHDAPALAELVLWALYSLLGERGLVLLSVLAAIWAFMLLGRGLTRQSSAGTAALLGLVVVAASLPTLLVARSYLFSLALFPTLLYLIEEDDRRPSRRLWLVVPLLALWSNLHGVALVGWAVLLAYLALARLRRGAWESLALGLAATIALCLTPLLWRTPDYYLQAMHNAAASRGFGLWEPLGTSGFDLALAAAAVALLALAAWSRPRLWECFALLALAVATVHAVRIGPWLLLLACYPAARRLRLGQPRARVVGALIVGLAAVALLALANGPLDPGSRSLAKRAAASGQTVLADGLLAEQVELYGGTVWVANPLDAFRLPDQRLYLDWLEGKPAGTAAVGRAGLVLVDSHSASGRRAAHDRRLVAVGRDRHFTLYRVVRP